LDEAKKFLFETYVVNGNNKEVMESIAKNGEVTVEFYDEETINYSYSPFWSNNNTVTKLDNLYSNRSFTNVNFYSYVNDTVLSNVNHTKSITNEIRELETGRVEKGSESNQSFVYDNSNFKIHPYVINLWKIKPNSTKIFISEDLVVYCTECGAKRKKDNHKFCPHCGTKY
jgi:hypothetical protein